MATKFHHNQIDENTDIVVWYNRSEKLWLFCVTNESTGGESDDLGGFKTKAEAVEAGKQYIADYNADDDSDARYDAYINERERAHFASQEYGSDEDRE